MKRGLMGILALAIALALVAGCSSRTYDASELALVRVSGANGFGKLEAGPDGQAVEAMLDRLVADLEDGDEEAYRLHFQREAVLHSLTFSADRTRGLKNGDELTIRADYDRDLAREASIRFRHTRFKYVVEFLK